MKHYFGKISFVIILMLLFAGQTVSAGPGNEINPPVIETNLPAVSYLSPSSSTDINDSISFTLSAQASERMVVKGIRLNIYDSGGQLVYTKEIGEAEQQPFFQRMLIGVGVARLKVEYELPPSLTWSGVTTSGGSLQEGIYSLEIEGWDDRGRTGKSDRYTVIIDNTDPYVEVTLPYSIFSPNSDGNKDILIIEQRGSSEALWQGVIYDTSGAEITTFSWRDEEPGNAIWDGLTNLGSRADDGQYNYQVSATDLAGNSVSFSFENVIVDTRDTPVSLGRDVAYFSPNGDDSIDSLTFLPDVPVQEGLKEWVITISDSKGTPVREYKGQNAVPEEVVFDGRNSSRRVLQEGAYRGHLSVLYTNGNNPTAYSPDFTIDLTAPTVSVKVFPLIFSPNGDGKKDEIQIYQETSEEDSWTGVIADSSGKTVRSFTWRGRSDSQLIWNGRDGKNEMVLDGSYTYTLSTYDKAGNYAAAKSVAFNLDTRVTPVKLAIDGTYFSPNADGNKDTITILPEIEDPIGLEQMTVKILDRADIVVRTFTGNRPLESIVWDGKTDSARTATDGEYSADIELIYTNGNNPKGRTGPIIIDTRFPKAAISVGNLFFSPDEDGRQDTIAIRQTGATEEDLWAATIKDEKGDDVRAFNWPGIPLSFEWNGNDDQGNRLPDGKYTYQVSSTDAAGNKATFSIPGITIDTRDTPVSVKISNSAFSPDGDGSLDDIVLTTQLEIKENVDNWALEILDNRELVQRKYSGTSNVPETLIFDGKNSQNRVLPEGEYRAKLSVLYKNGSKPTALSPAFVIDISPPTAQVSAENDIFSPNGDGNKDTISIVQRGTSEPEWKGLIVDQNDRVIRTFTWFEGLEPSVVWNGRDDSGKPVADGTYSYSVIAVDRAGNEGTSNRISVIQDTRSTQVSLSANMGQFSPNNDRVKDTIVLRPDISIRDDIVSYVFTVHEKTGSIVYTRSGLSAVPAGLSWNGAYDSGQKAADAEYYAQLEVTYKNGNKPLAKSPAFTIDTVAPSATISTGYLLFSPDGDGKRDVVSITQSSSFEDLWEGAIVDDKGNKVWNYFWKGNASAFDWNGNDDNGSPVKDGLYSYVVSSTDKAGNSARAEMPGIEVDTRLTSGYVSPSTAAISPNGDGNKDTVRINLYKNLSEGIWNWSLTILDSQKRAVRDLVRLSRAEMPSYVVWDGKLNDGSVKDGEYTAELVINYEKGNSVLTQSATAITVDTTPPAFVFNIRPSPFSPDDDGVEDRVSLSFANVTDVSSIESWSIEVFDPREALFFEASGRGKPARSIVWDGKSKEGELVQAAEDYPVTIKMQDSLGNSVVKRDNIPVDILVFRDGENLKIRISSIQFAPDSPDFREFDEEKAAKNMKTLTRLAEILKKYAAYQIRIEGHAVSVYWNNAERAKREEAEELKPLSKARAEAVKETLVELGITRSRMTTVGMGGTQPIVPHSDLDNRWKSRRVEFILVK